MKKLCAVVVAMAGAALLVPAQTVFAHHSFSAQYDAGKPFKLKGAIAKMEWINPHGILFVDVKDASGKVERWQLEFGAPANLFKRGWRYQDLPVGAEVTVSGYRCKDGATCGNASDVILANGKKLFAGSSGTGAPSDNRQPQ